MKITYVTSISPSYMFSLNCLFNSNMFYDVNADFVVLYDHYMKTGEQEYMETCSKSFPFKITWVDMNKYSHCFHNAKYAVVKDLQDYDAVCLIDSDLFICTNTLEHFHRAATEKILATATHMWSGGNANWNFYGEPDRVNNRDVCQLADFPVFINPTFAQPFMKKWKENTEDDSKDHEWQHPFVSFNRAICEHFKREQIIDLDGRLWVCDNNFWTTSYTVGVGHDGKLRMMTDIFGKDNLTEVCANHNKWWKEGRCSGEWLYYRYVYDNPEQHPHLVENLDRGQRNFNNIRDFMMIFNNMTPATKRTDFNAEKIDWRDYLSKAPRN